MTQPGHPIPEIVKIAFLIGAVLSLATIAYSVVRVPELPLEESERARIAALPRGFGAALGEVADAIRDMPPAMLRHYATLHGVEYLPGQVYLEPHPKELALRNHV